MDQMSDYQEPSENIDLKQYAINHVVDGIYWMDEHSRIQEVNDGACRMVGYSREELTSMTVGQLNPDISIERWRAQWDLLQRQGTRTAALSMSKSPQTSLFTMAGRWFAPLCAISPNASGTSA
jgi:PAS domain-containing protein